MTFGDDLRGPAGGVGAWAGIHKLFCRGELYCTSICKLFHILDKLLVFVIQMNFLCIQHSFLDYFSSYFQ